MGAASAKFPTIRMPYRSKSRSRNKHHRAKLKPKVAVALLGTAETAKAIGDHQKPDPYALPATSIPVTRKPRVLVVNLVDDEESSQLSELPSEFLRKRRSTAEVIQELERLESEFQEFDVVTQEYPEADPTTLVKNRKFVIAWKSGLSHRLTKLGPHSTDIPVLATAFCRIKRSKWKDCCRSHIICHSKGEEEADVETYQQHISHAHATHHIVRNVHGKVLFNSSIVSVEQREEREKRMAVVSQVFSQKETPVSRIPYESNPLGSISGSIHGGASSPILENFVQEKRASLIGNGSGSTKNEIEILKRKFSDSQLLNERKNVASNKIGLGDVNC